MHFEKVIVTYLEKTFEFPETKMTTTLDLGRQSPGWVKHYEMSWHVTQPGLRHCQWRWARLLPLPHPWIFPLFPSRFMHQKCVFCNWQKEEVGKGRRQTDGGDDTASAPCPAPGPRFEPTSQEGWELQGDRTEAGATCSWQCFPHKDFLGHSN